MKWVTKNQLRIENARLQTQAESYLAQLRAAESTIAKLESLVDHERERIDAERSRADHATDRLLQQNGVAPITELGRQETAELAEEAKEQIEVVRKRIGEFYAENIDDVESDSEISPEIKAILSGVNEVIA